MNKSKMESVSDYQPPWLQGKNIDEREFALEFLTIYPMRYYGGHFYSKEGAVEEAQVRKNLYNQLSSRITSSLSAKVASLMEVVKLEAQAPMPPLNPNRIHCANGYYDLEEEKFHKGEHEYCRNRLPVKYAQEPSPIPKWEAFLNDLLEPGDILTLQEFMGYCLIPTTKAQRMLILVGKGGEGKSRIGHVLFHLLGQSMCNGSLSKLETNRFARADLENRLVMVDDDLKMEGLPSTNTIKTLVTADTLIDVERKGRQSYQTQLYCRFLAFGNGTLRALHDRSHGFFRRQMVITVKERPEDRVDNPDLSQELLSELEGIFKWCIAGLLRLKWNNMQFIVTDRSLRNLEEAVSEGNSIPEFMDSQGYIRLDTAGECTCRQLYSAYQDWCEDNMLTPLGPKSFSAWLIQNQDRYRIRYNNNCNGGSGRKVRGFRGLRRV